MEGEGSGGGVEKGAYLGELTCQHGPLAVGAVPGTHQLRGDTLMHQAGHVTVM